MTLKVLEFETNRTVSKNSHDTVKDAGALHGVSRRLSDYLTILVFHRVAFIEQERGKHCLLNRLLS